MTHLNSPGRLLQSCRQPVRWSWYHRAAGLILSHPSHQDPPPQWAIVFICISSRKNRADCHTQGRDQILHRQWIIKLPPYWFLVYLLLVVNDDFCPGNKEWKLAWNQLFITRKPPAERFRWLQYGGECVYAQLNVCVECTILSCYPILNVCSVSESMNSLLNENIQQDWCRPPP